MAIENYLSYSTKSFYTNAKNKNFKKCILRGRIIYSNIFNFCDEGTTFENVILIVKKCQPTCFCHPQS